MKKIIEWDSGNEWHRIIKFLTLYKDLFNLYLCSRIASQVLNKEICLLEYFLYFRGKMRKRNYLYLEKKANILTVTNTSITAKNLGMFD